MVTLLKPHKVGQVPAGMHSSVTYSTKIVADVSTSQLPTMAPAESVGKVQVSSNTTVTMVTTVTSHQNRPGKPLRELPLGQTQ